MLGFWLVRDLRWAAFARLVSLVADAGAGQDPFAVTSVRVPGRPVQVEEGRFGGNFKHNSLDWMVFSVSGAPPDEVRSISVFPCRPGPAIATAPRLTSGD